MATFLLYINSVFSLLFGFSVIGLAIAVGGIAAGFGIANEQRWGYLLGVVVAVVGLVPLILYIAANGLSSIFDVTLLLSALFPVALFALLVHPMSRNYQKIWFH